MLPVDWLNSKPLTSPRVWGAVQLEVPDARFSVASETNLKQNSVNREAKRKKKNRREYERLIKNKITSVL